MIGLGKCTSGFKLWLLLAYLALKISGVLRFLESTKAIALRLITGITATGLGRCLLSSFGGPMSQVFDVRITGLQMGAVLIAYKRHKVTELYTADTLDNEKVAWTVGVTILTLIVGESIARISGLMPPVKRGDFQTIITDKFGHLVEHRIRNIHRIPRFFEECENLGDRRCDIKSGGSSDITGAFKHGKQVEGGLPVQGPALAFATMMICCCIMFSGRSALSENSAFRVANLLLPQASKRCR